MIRYNRYDRAAATLGGGESAATATIGGGDAAAATIGGGDAAAATIGGGDVFHVICNFYILNIVI